MRVTTKRPTLRVLFSLLALGPLACGGNSTEPAPVVVATQLAFTAQPSNVAAGAAISPTLQVTARDASGNPVSSFTGSVTIAIGTNPGGGTLAGTATVAATSGVASFATLSINNLGTGYTLTASATGLTGATSAVFNVTAGSATQLAFTVQPSSVAAGAAISPAVQVTARDALGNTATTFTGNVTIAIGTNPGGGTLSGTATIAATSGVASFANLSINNGGSGYTLTAAATGLSGATSSGFTLTAPLLFASVFGGESHTCALTSAGAAYCWGLNTDGQLGNNGTTNRNRPTAVSGGLSFTVLGLGRFHTCGLTTAGAAYCWGFNNAGQLGDSLPTTIARPLPRAVSGGRTFTALTVGGYHTCGLVSGGAAYCWGHGQYGELGDSATIGSGVPKAVVGGLSFTALSAGNYQTCGRTSGGAAYCWGNNTSGQLGDSTTTNRSAPTPVSGGISFAVLSPGGSGVSFAHACGLTSAGAAYCWGRGDYGVLGDGTTTTIRTTPVAVSGGLSFGAVSATGLHVCGRTSAGAAYCWGFNNTGQLGDGTSTNRAAPTAVLGGLSFAAVSGGGNHACGLTAGGAAYCWGGNFSGQLGDGTNTTRLAPVPVAQ